MNFQKALAVLTFPLFTLTAFAQHPNADILKCRTTDGDVVITANGIFLRDYQFVMMEVLGEGIVKLADPRVGAFAILDTRGEDGVYLEVTDGGGTMLVVASRAEMTLIEAPENIQRPASPTASVPIRNNLVILAHAQH